MTTEQFQVGVHISNVDQLQPGDIVFFQDSTGYIHHEGIYIGNHMFLHAPHTGDVVKVSSLDEPYYAQQFAGGSDVSGLAHGAVPPAARGAERTPPPPVGRRPRPRPPRPGRRRSRRSRGRRTARAATAASSEPSPTGPSNPPPRGQHRPDPSGRQRPERRAGV